MDVLFRHASRQVCLFKRKDYKNISFDFDKIEKQDKTTVEDNR